MKKFLLLFSFITTFSLSSNAFSGVLIEPYLGFSLNGDGEMTTTLLSFDQSYSGLAYGGRLGYSMLGLMAGLDYSMQSFDLESEFTAGGTKYTAKDSMDKKQLGLFVGYEFPIMLRAWATYFLSASMEGTDPDLTSGSQVYDNRDEVEDGGGYALGVGFTGLPFVSINLEYRTFEFDTIKTSGVEATNITKKQKLSEILLSVSLPLNL